MSESPNILLVDDDFALLDVLAMALEEAGFIVRTAHDGAAGWEEFLRKAPDLVVLDLLMPEMDGLEFCQRLREEHTTPVIMLTSRAEEMDRVLGLQMGADDYITKPFSTRELIARIRATLRRVNMDLGPSTIKAIKQAGPLRIDRDQRKVWLHDVAIELTSTEFDLLWTLVGNPGHVFSRDDLIDRVYGEDVVVSYRTIDTFVKRLRQKLSQVDEDFCPIVTVRSVGYRFEER